MDDRLENIDASFRRHHPAIEKTVDEPHDALVIALMKAVGEQDKELFAPKDNDFTGAERVVHAAVDAAKQVSAAPSRLEWQPVKLASAFKTLYQTFDTLPGLKDVAPSERHRLIVYRENLLDFESRAGELGVDAKQSPFSGLILGRSGYLHGMAEGYRTAFQDLGSDLSANLLERIHRAIVGTQDGIVGGFDDAHDVGVSRRLRRGEPDNTMSPEGFEETRMLKQELAERRGKSAPFIVQNDARDGFCTIGRIPSEPGTLAEIVDMWALDLKRSVAKVGDGHDLESRTLRALCAIDVIQKVLRLHPCQDANGRLLQKIGLNRELQRLGLPLTALGKAELHGVSLAEALKLVVERQIPMRGREALRPTDEQMATAVARYKAEFAYQPPRLSADAHAQPMNSLAAQTECSDDAPCEFDFEAAADAWDELH